MKKIIPGLGEERRSHFIRCFWNIYVEWRVVVPCPFKVGRESLLKISENTCCKNAYLFRLYCLFLVFSLKKNIKFKCGEALKIIDSLILQCSQTIIKSFFLIRKWWSWVNSEQRKVATFFPGSKWSLVPILSRCWDRSDFW